MKRLAFASLVLVMLVGSAAPGSARGPTFVGGDDTVSATGKSDAARWSVTTCNACFPGSDAVRVRIAEQNRATDMLVWKDPSGTWHLDYDVSRHGEVRRSGSVTSF